eukprot:7085965-Lingulodinium_polyedra.AAC.1
MTPATFRYIADHVRKLASIILHDKDFNQEEIRMECEVSVATLEGQADLMDSRSCSNLKNWGHGRHYCMNFLVKIICLTGHLKGVAHRRDAMVATLR